MKEFETIIPYVSVPEYVKTYKLGSQCHHVETYHGMDTSKYFEAIYRIQSTLMKAKVIALRLFKPEL